MEVKINSVRLLASFEPPKDQKFLLYTYALNPSPKPEDNEYGIYIAMGVYTTYEEAKKRGEELIEMTGFPVMKVSELSRWGHLSIEDKNSVINVVPIDATSRKLIPYQERIWEKEDEYKKSIQKMIDEDDKKKDLYNNPNSFEYYQLHMINVLNNMEKVEKGIDRLNKCLDKNVNFEAKFLESIKSSDKDKSLLDLYNRYERQIFNRRRGRDADQKYGVNNSEKQTSKKILSKKSSEKLVSGVELNHKPSNSHIDINKPIEVLAVNDNKPIEVPPTDTVKPIEVLAVNDNKPVEVPPTDINKPVEVPPTDINKPVEVPPTDINKPVEVPPTDINKPVEVPPTDI